MQNMKIRERPTVAYYPLFHGEYRGSNPRGDATKRRPENMIGPFVFNRLRACFANSTCIANPERDESTEILRKIPVCDARLPVASASSKLARGFDLRSSPFGKMPPPARNP